MWAIVKTDQEGKRYVEQTVLNPVPFSVEGKIYDIITFTKGPEYLASLGVYPLYVDKVDERFWIKIGTQLVIDDVEQKVTEMIVKEPRDTSWVKQAVQHEINVMAYERLLKTDWMITRAWETNGAKPVPMEILRWREEIRKICDRKQLDIKSLDTIEQLEAYDIDEGWPVFEPRTEVEEHVTVLQAEQARVREVMEKRRQIAAYLESKRKAAEEEEMAKIQEATPEYIQTETEE